MAKVPTITLNNGVQQPAIALGTYTSLESEGFEAIKLAIDAGYRQFDTASFYFNEEEVGRAVRAKIDEGVVKREEVSVITKLWNTEHKPEDVEPSCRLSNEKLGLGYIDLYLLHWPMAFNYVPGNAKSLTESGETANADIDYLDTWKAIENLVDLGLVKSIGVSNFNSQQIDRLLQNCRIKPVCNQIEVSPHVTQKKLIKFCKDRDLSVMAYCPLAISHRTKEKPKFYSDPKFLEIGQKYNKSSAQLTLRYLVDVGVIPLPKSVSKNRIHENIDIFDFQLTDEEIAYIDTFHTGERISLYEAARNNIHYPFAIDF